jgi:hypothetical protein
MSMSLGFVVLSSSSQLTQPDAQVAIRLNHFGDSKGFIAQFLDLELYGFDCYSKPIIETHEVPRGFSLMSDGELTDTDPLSPPWGSHRFRYMYANQIHQTVLPDWAGDLDRAMMAYLMALDSDRVIVLCIS